MASLAEMTTPAEDSHDCWRTPPALFHTLNLRYNFGVDAASDDDNALCLQHWTVRGDGVAKLADRSNDYLRAWANPPYSNIEPWAAAAYERALRGAFTALLLPANRTQCPWWHDYALRAELWFFRGRIRFRPPPGLSESSPRGNSVLVVFDPRTLGRGVIGSLCPETGAVIG
jgi:DNA (cytosine-5)-methyltransferase 1